jgi:hypothetical protein
MGKVEPIHHSIPAQQVGQLSNVRHDPSCLILRERLGRCSLLRPCVYSNLAQG